MKIDPKLINMQSVYFGWTIALIPFVYQRYLINKNYVWIFIISQAAYIFAESIGILAGSRLNL